jgi:hypothetical protein
MSKMQTTGKENGTGLLYDVNYLFNVNNDIHVEFNVFLGFFNLLTPRTDSDLVFEGYRVYKSNDPFPSRHLEETWRTLLSHSVTCYSLVPITHSNRRIQIRKTRWSSSKVTLSNMFVSTSITSSESTNLRFRNTVLTHPKTRSHMGGDQVNRVDGPAFPPSFSYFLRCFPSTGHSRIVDLNCHYFCYPMSAAVIAFFVNPFKYLCHFLFSGDSPWQVIMISRLATPIASYATARSRNRRQMAFVCKWGCIVPSKIFMKCIKASDDASDWAAQGNNNKIGWSGNFWQWCSNSMRYITKEDHRYRLLPLRQVGTSPLICSVLWGNLV